MRNLSAAQSVTRNSVGAIIWRLMKESTLMRCHHLKTHERIHTDEKPFSCSKCDKAFRDSGHLKKHERIHTGEKPFSCSRCDKKFRDSSNLKTHERIHTYEKPFSCPKCEKKFHQAGQLKKHETIHTCEKPFRNSKWQEIQAVRWLAMTSKIHTDEKHPR